MMRLTPPSLILLFLFAVCHYSTLCSAQNPDEFACDDEHQGNCCTTLDNIDGDFDGEDDVRCYVLIPGGNIQVEPESDFRLYCDPGTEGEINRCEWESPNGAICEFDRDNQEGDSCGGIEGVEFEGELDNGNGNCQIYVNDAREEIHDGTWKCSMKVGPTMYDYVNVEVSYDDDDDGLTPGQIAAIAVSCGLVFLALLILLLMCCLCPAVFDKCRGEKKEKNKKIYVHEAPRHHPPPPPPPQVVVETRRRSRSSSSSDEERRRNRRQNRKRSSSSSSDDRRRRQKRSTNQPEFITVTTRHDHSAATRSYPPKPHRQHQRRRSRSSSSSSDSFRDRKQYHTYSNSTMEAVGRGRYDDVVVYTTAQPAEEQWHNQRRAERLSNHSISRY